MINFESRPPDELNSKLGAFASREKPLSLEISFVGVAKTNCSIMMLPVVTQKLLYLHNQLFELAREIGITALRYYQVDTWMPHITVADETDFEDFDAALKVVLSSDFTKPVRIQSIRLIEFKPCKELCRFELAG